MKKYKLQKILSLLLIVTFLCAGLSFFTPEDANNDSKIDLKDAILTAQCVSSEDHIHNQAAADVCVSVIKAIAHIKNISTPSNQSDKFSFLSFCFLLSALDQKQFFISLGTITTSVIPYMSITSSPDVFPPILS